MKHSGGNLGRNEKQERRMPARVLAFVLSLVLALSAVPTTVFAEEPGTTPSITLGTQESTLTYGDDGEASFAITSTGVEWEEGTWSVRFHESNDAESAYMESLAGTTATVEGGKLVIRISREAQASVRYLELVSGEVHSNLVEYTVGKRPVTITSGSAQKVYDGTPLTCEAYEVSGFPDGDGVEVVCTGAQTEVGASDNTFTYSANSGTNLENYDITEIMGKLTVTDASFVIVGENYSGVYDGQNHTFTVKVIGKNGVDHTSGASIQYAFSSDGVNWSDWQSDAPIVKDARKLYVKAEVTAAIGGTTKTIGSAVYTMEVTKRSLVLTSGSAAKTYDGTPLTKQNVTVSGFASDEGFKSGSEPKATGTITKVGRVDNTIDRSSCKAKENTNLGNYQIVENLGTLTVTPKLTPITITTPSVTKTYDGKVIEPGNATYTSGILAPGDALTVTLKYSGENAVKNAGTYENAIATENVPNKGEVLKYSVTNEAGEDVTACYTFAEPVIGTLTILPRNVTLTSGSDLQVSGAGVNSAGNTAVRESGDGLLSDEKLSYSDFPTVTEISYTPTRNTFTYAAAQGSNFVESNYNITVEYGYLMLVEEMSLLGVDQTFTYDGTVHNAPAALIDNGQGQSVKVTYSTSTDNKNWSAYSETVPSVKDAGTLYVRVVAKKGVQRKEGSYTVTVNPREVILNTASATKSYDATALKAESYTVSGQGFVGNDGTALMLTYTGAQTVVGSSANTANYTLNPSVKTENYAITVNPGTLTVTPNNATIRITTDSASQTYNGMALTCAGYTATWADGNIENGMLCGSDMLTVIPASSITDVGSVKNQVRYRVMRGDEDVTAFYTFAEVEEGTLTVKPRSIVITTGSAEKVYDGTALTNGDYTVTGEGFVEGEGFDAVSVSGSRTNAGTSKNKLDAETPYVFAEGTSADNYKVTVKTGTLTVNKRKVTVTSGSAVSTYDDCPQGGLTCTTVEVSGGGFVPGEVAEGYPKGAGSLPKPDSEPASPDTASNCIDYGWTGCGNPANYEITECLGTLAITNNADMYAVATDYVGVYDGMPHKISFSTSVLDPDSVKYSIDNIAWSDEEPTFTDATQGTKVYIKVTKDDKTATCSAAVTIYRRELTLTSGSAEKIYDGTPLTCDSYTVGGDGLVSGEEPTISFTKAQTDAGKSINKIVMLKDSDPFKTKNYKITYYYGNLTVTKRPVVLISESAEVTYDGFSHSSENVIVVGDTENGSLKNIPSMGFAGDEGVTYSKFSTATNVGTYLNSFEYEAKSETDLENYDLKTIFGTVRINPRTVTLTSASAQKMYDGEALTDDTVTVGGDGFAEGNGADFTVTGTRTVVGKSANTFSYTLKNGTKAGNYVITCTEGTLEVYDCNTLRIVVPENREYTYDGKPHGEAARAYIGDTPCTDTVWYSVDGGETYTAEVPQLTDAGSITVLVYVEKDNYVKAEGTYTVTVKAAENARKDSEESGKGTTESGKTSAGAVKTGDSSNLMLYFVLLVASAAALSVVFVRTRKERKHR